MDEVIEKLIDGYAELTIDDEPQTRELIGLVHKYCEAEGTLNSVKCPTGGRLLLMALGLPHKAAKVPAKGSGVWQIKALDVPVNMEKLDDRVKDAISAAVEEKAREAVAISDPIAQLKNLVMATPGLQERGLLRSYDFQNSRQTTVTVLDAKATTATVVFETPCAKDAACIVCHLRSGQTETLVPHLNSVVGKVGYQYAPATIDLHYKEREDSKDSLPQPLLAILTPIKGVTVPANKTYELLDYTSTSMLHRALERPGAREDPMKLAEAALDFATSAGACVLNCHTVPVRQASISPELKAMLSSEELQRIVCIQYHDSMGVKIALAGENFVVGTQGQHLRLTFLKKPQAENPSNPAASNPMAYAVTLTRTDDNHKQLMPSSALSKLATLLRDVLNRKGVVKALQMLSMAHIKSQGSGKATAPDPTASHARLVTALNASNEMVELNYSDDAEIAACIRLVVQAGAKPEVIPWDRRPPAGSNGDSINLRGCHALALPFTDPVSMGTFVLSAGLGMARGSGPLADNGQISVDDFRFALGISAEAAEVVGGPEVVWRKYGGADPLYNQMAPMVYGAAICAGENIRSSISSTLFANGKDMGELLSKGACAALRGPAFTIVEPPKPMLASPRAAAFDVGRVLAEMGHSELAALLDFSGSDEEDRGTDDEDTGGNSAGAAAAANADGKGADSTGATVAAAGTVGDGQNGTSAAAAATDTVGNGTGNTGAAAATPGAPEPVVAPASMSPAQQHEDAAENDKDTEMTEAELREREAARRAREHSGSGDSPANKKGKKGKKGKQP